MKLINLTSTTTGAQSHLKHEFNAFSSFSAADSLSTTIRSRLEIKSNKIKPIEAVKKDNYVDVDEKNEKQLIQGYIYTYLHIFILFLFKSYSLVKKQVLAMYYLTFGSSYLNGHVATVESNSMLSAPKNVCIILNEETSLCESDRNLLETNFSYLIDYLENLGTRTITFYKTAFNEFDLDLKSKLLSKYSSRDINNNSNYDDEHTRGTNKSISLRFLTNNQVGKRLFVNACRNLANRVKSKQLNCEEINQDIVNAEILELNDMNEPELVITIGEQDSLAGFSPWHLRLSEIIKIESYRLINRDIINSVLNKYNKIEKRFGK